MSLLQKIIFASYARSTHHKMALDALQFLQGPNAAQWRDLLLSEYGSYLQGAKDPDDRFKDFKNHVLHVRENFWGGAVAAAEHWYGQLVDQLRAKAWKDSAYSAGVLSHYFTDPHMPFHTGQSGQVTSGERKTCATVSRGRSAEYSTYRTEFGTTSPGRDTLHSACRRDATTCSENSHCPCNTSCDHKNFNRPKSSVDRQFDSTAILSERR